MNIPNKLYKEYQGEITEHDFIEIINNEGFIHYSTNTSTIHYTNNLNLFVDYRHEIKESDIKEALLTSSCFTDKQQCIEYCIKKYEKRIDRLKNNLADTVEYLNKLLKL